jgi:adenylate cyclase
MDWEAEGLLDGLEDDDARKSRVELLDYLHDEGCDVDELEQAVAEERLVLLPVERLLAGDKSYSQRQIAEETGLELDELREFRRALGLAIPDADAEVLGDADLEGA